MTGRDRPFALALGIWLLAGLVLWLLSARLGEILPKPAFATVMSTAFLLPPLVLIVWAIVRALRKRGSWLAAPAVIVAAITLVAAGIPLYPASIYLNFWSHRSQYDSVVAEAKAGRLPPAASDGWVSGKRHGVAYGYAPGTPSVIVFPWGEEGYHGPTGIVFDEHDCPPKPTPPQAEPRAGEPTMKNAGRIDERWRIDGAYCFSVPRG